MAAQEQSTLASAKRKARNAAKVRREAVDSRPDKSQRGGDRALPLLLDHATIGVYSALGTEFDASHLVSQLSKRGATLLYPRVSPRSRVLEFCQALPADLRPSSFGVPEPAPELHPHPLSGITAFVIPGLSFDRKGGRLGWGKGYYDHTLARCPNAVRIGICFHEQITESLPCEESDQTMDWIVTDKDTFAGPRRHVGGSKTPTI